MPESIDPTESFVKVKFQHPGRHRDDVIPPPINMTTTLMLDRWCSQNNGVLKVVKHETDDWRVEVWLGNMIQVKARGQSPEDAATKIVASMLIEFERIQDRHLVKATRDAAREWAISVLKAIARGRLGLGSETFDM